ncbi:MAG TPA: LytTR family DNA-binding domain-containing protein [Thermoanaerobaculia bacterium]|nr:LytTR family DNA-binding domain-containing protein [Thermoanaerobaculia bacterium]
MISKPVVVIADDEPPARRALRSHLAAIDWIGEVHEAGDGRAAIRAVDALRPDVLFLDIVMPGATGLEVVERITHRPYVVFTTAYERYAVTAFEIGALDFLLKPFGRERVLAAAERARSAIELGMPPVVARAREAFAVPGPISRVFVRERGKVVAVPLDGVERLEACDDYVALHAGGRQHLIHARLQDLESRLDPSRFVRIHRSHVINLDFLVEIQPREGSRLTAVMKSGARILASRTGAPRLKAGVSRANAHLS